MTIPLTAPAEMLQQAWQDYKSRVGGFMGIAALQLPLSLAIIVIALRAEQIAQKTQQINLESLVPYLPALAIGIIAAILIGLVTQIAFYLQAGTDAEQSVVELVKRAFKLLPKYIGASLVLFLVVLGGFLLFIVPGIIWSVWYGFAPLIALFEDKQGWATMERSKQIVVGRSWPVVGRLLFLALMLGLIEIGLSLPFSIIHESLGSLAGTLLRILVLTPLGAIYSYRLYKELSATAAPNEAEPAPAV
jgi:hypothetical protein